MNGEAPGVWLWEAAHACGVTDDRERAMLCAEDHLATGAVALVERAIVADSPRGGTLHVRTGTRWTGQRTGDGCVQWAEANPAGEARATEGEDRRCLTTRTTTS